MLRAAIIFALALGLVVAGMPEPVSAATHKKHHKKSSSAKKTTASKGKKSSSSHKKAAASKGKKSSSTKRAAASKGRKGSSKHGKSLASSRKRGKKRSSHREAAAPRRSQQRLPSPERYKEIQEALITKGYLKGPATGAWDAESIAALKRFQTDQKLDPDGKLESLTLIALGLGPKNSPIATNSQSSVSRTP